MPVVGMVRAGNANQFQDAPTMFVAILILDWIDHAPESAVRENDQVFALAVVTFLLTGRTTGDDDLFSVPDAGFDVL